MSSRCVPLGDKHLPRILAGSSIVFIVMGSVVLAPFWWFDGFSMGVTCVVGLTAIRRALHAQPDSTGTHIAYCRFVCILAAITILVDISFLAVALVRWNNVMNPLHHYIRYTTYGRDGSAFFFCSLYTACINVWVLIHFYQMSHRLPPNKMSSADP